MPGTKFKKNDLGPAVEELFDSRLTKVKLELEAELAVSDEQARREWREEQTARVLNLAASIERGTCSDEELSRFSTKNMSYREQEYTVSNLRSKIENLEAKKTRAVLACKAMAADEDGNVTLFTADLKRLGLGD